MAHAAMPFRRKKMDTSSNTASPATSVTSQVTRRGFFNRAALGASAVAAANMSVLDVLQSSALADVIKRNDKRVILFWLAGGASQLETFDPKPGRPTGGPYRA